MRAQRPANRRDLVLSAASDLFKIEGFDNVGMAQIAAAVEMTAPALYRHFESKQDLLMQVIDVSVSGFEETIDQATARADGPTALEDLATDLARLSVDYQGTGVLWQRESRHLPLDVRTQLRHRIRAQVMKVSGIVARYLPARDAFHAEVLAWAALAIITSPSRHRSRIPPASSHEVRTGIILDMWRSGAGLQMPEPRPGNRPTSLTLHRTSRREALIDAAIYTFARRGYPEAKMEEIGAFVGITGPSVHHHFPRKSLLLSEATARGADWLRIDLSRALGTAQDSRQAIERLIEGHLSFAFDLSDLAQVMTSEVHYLPREEADAVHAVQDDYLNQWVSLLRSIHEQMSADEAHLRVYGALSIITDIGRLARIVGSVAVLPRDVGHLAAGTLRITLPSTSPA